MANLGDEAKDSVTGFKGIVIGITAWLNGCRRIGLQPQSLGNDGKPIDVQWFDEPQVQVTKAGKVAPAIPNQPTIPTTTGYRPGGPRNDPKRF